jgi:hypothetical protein
MVEVMSNAIEVCEFRYPTVEFPYYHVVIIVRLDGTSMRVERITVNGSESRDFRVFNGDTESFDRVIDGGVRSTITVRVDWKNEASYGLQIHCRSPSHGGEVILKQASLRTPSYGGYWNRDWKYYVGVVLSETAGIARHREPVHLSLSVYEDRIASPREIRVVGVDPETGTAKETQSQVYGFEEWAAAQLMEQEPFRYQPSRTLDLAFIADVPANSQKVYLVFYGNPKASEPQYQTDLNVSGKALQLDIENDYYNVKLHDRSGLIDEITMKQGVDIKLDHHVEPPGTLHWNPDCYTPPRTWSHASNWDPPPNSTGIDGPVFLMRKYWGKLPFDVDQVSASLTYLFYAHNPYVIISTTMRVDAALPVKVLRNGCFVLRRDLFNEFTWKDRAGKVNRKNLTGAPAPPNAVMTLAPDTPWMAFVNSDRGLGFGGITLSYVNDRFEEGLVKLTQPHFHVMVGPWVAWSRLLVNTIMTNNPQRMVQVPKGCFYLERNAYLPFKLDPSRDKECDILDINWKKLINPLEVVQLSMDTDERVPREPVAPILPEGFEI